MKAIRVRFIGSTPSLCWKRDHAKAQRRKDAKEISEKKAAIKSASKLSRCGRDSPSGLHGDIDKNEILGGIQIVFAGFVDHSQILASACGFIGEDPVNLSKFQIRLSSGNTEGKLDLLGGF